MEFDNLLNSVNRKQTDGNLPDLTSRTKTDEPETPPKDEEKSGRFSDVLDESQSHAAAS